jgi:DNA polymerase III subunit delta
MKIYAEQLKQHCSTLAPIYIISGDEPLLIQEAADYIRAQAKNQGFMNREIFNIGKSFDWPSFYTRSDNFSLFAEKQLLELRFIQKPDTAGKKALEHYLKNINDNNLLLITFPKIDAAAQKTAWFKALDTKSIHLPIWPINIEQLPAWIKKRASQFKLVLSDQATQLIADQTEGNLLAVHQTIEKLSLTSASPKETQTLDDDTVIAALSDHSRFDVFALVDACLSRKPNRISKVLAGLKGEGVEPVLILWALHRETQTLLSIMNAISMGASANQAMAQMRIWDKRKQLLNPFLKHCKKQQLYDCIQLSAQLDRCIKGLEQGNVWMLLLNLSLTLSNNINKEILT